MELERVRRSEAKGARMQTATSFTEIRKQSEQKSSKNLQHSRHASAAFGAKPVVKVSTVELWVLSKMSGKGSGKACNLCYEIHHSSSQVNQSIGI